VDKNINEQKLKRRRKKKCDDLKLLGVQKSRKMFKTFSKQNKEDKTKTESSEKTTERDLLVLNISNK
jgi:hypothetical protein